MGYVACYLKQNSELDTQIQSVYQTLSQTPFRRDKLRFFIDYDVKGRTDNKEYDGMLNQIRDRQVEGMILPFSPADGRNKVDWLLFQETCRSFSIPIFVAGEGEIKANVNMESLLSQLGNAG